MRCLATVFNEFEIHVDLPTEFGGAADVTHPAMDVKDKVWEEVDFVLKKHGSIPYKLKYIENYPQALADFQHENGEEIRCPYAERQTTTRIGTVGAFMSEAEDDKTMLAATCAHVVKPPRSATVYIVEELRAVELGQTEDDFTIHFAQDPQFSLIDFGVVRVQGEIKEKCMALLKDENGKHRSSIIADAMDCFNVGQRVYKYGAKSYLTKGIVASCDVSVQGSNGEYLSMMIEPLPGDELDKFADNGDSGSVVCRDSLKSDCTGNEPINVLSMVSSGEYKLRHVDENENDASNITLAFSMKTALNLVTRNTRKTLTLA